MFFLCQGAFSGSIGRGDLELRRFCFCLTVKCRHVVDPFFHDWFPCNDSHVMVVDDSFCRKRFTWHRYAHDIRFQEGKNQLPNLCRSPQLLQPLRGLKYFEASAKSSAVVFVTTVAGCSFFREQLLEWCCPFLMWWCWSSTLHYTTHIWFLSQSSFKTFNFTIHHSIHNPYMNLAIVLPTQRLHYLKANNLQFSDVVHLLRFPNLWSLHRFEWSLQVPGSPWTS